MGTAKRHFLVQRHLRALVAASCVSTLVLVLGPAAPASAASASFAPPVQYEGGYLPFSVSAGDFNDDGDPDLVVVNGSGTALSVLIGGPGGSFGAPTDYPVGDVPLSATVGDFNADGDPDLVVPNSDSNNVSVLLGGPGGTFGAATNFTVGLHPSSVDVDDFNDDGDPDLVVANQHSDSVSVLLGGPGGTFGGATNQPVGSFPNSVVVGDFNADSDPDLAVASEWDGTVSVLLGGPGGSFGAATDFAAGTGPSSVAVGDFNADSDPDLAFGTDEAGVTVLLGGPAGTFGSPTAYAGSGPDSPQVAVGDFNADSDLDLVLAGSTSGVMLFLGGPGGTFGAPTTIPTGGDTLSVAVGDFDGDSLPDLAVANYTSDNTAPTPEEGSVGVLLNTLDLAPPETTISTGPGGPTNDNTPTFGFGSSEAGSTFECRVDDASFAACTSPRTTAPLGEGSHTFEVRATDSSGNVDATPATRSFTVDRVAPSTTITSGPIGVIGDNTPTYGFTSPDDAAATFECRYDDEAFAACTSPYTTAALTDGAHVFRVRAIDSAGNVDPDPARANIHVDTTAPDTTITTGPSGLTTDNTPIFSFDAAVGVASFECRFDDAPFAACVSPVEDVVLADGEHTFELRAIDTAGNVDPTPDSRTFTVDTVVPDTTITGGPTGLTSDNTPTFTFTSTEPGSTFECFVTSAGFEPCTSPYTYAPQPEGSNSFIVHAIDPAGNVDATAANRSFYVDTAAPDTEITSGPSGPIADSTPTFGFDANEGTATFECRLDSAAFAACTSPHTTTALADGSHTFEVRATDAAGNVDTTPASRTVVVDATAPETTITGGPSGPTGDATPTFDFSSPDAGATFECRIDSAAFAACTSPFTTAALTEGSHTFQVRATDPNGNTDPTPASRTFAVNLDSNPPQTTVTRGPNLLTLSGKATFTFTSSEEGSSFECRLDGDGWQACTSPQTYTGLRLGNHTFEVRATDPAGNTDPTPAERSWLALVLLPLL